MEWQFTPEQVVKGEVGYGLEAFRRDLMQEIRVNTGDSGEGTLPGTGDLVYDLCYWRATGKSFADFVAGFRHDPPTTEFLFGVNEHMDANVAMLGAILQRLIMDRVEVGMPLEHAIRDVARHHSEVVRTGAAGLPG
jgi:hypothetical protein